MAQHEPLNMTSYGPQKPRPVEPPIVKPVHRVTWEDVRSRITLITGKYVRLIQSRPSPLTIYGVPRGGMIAASFFPRRDFRCVVRPCEANLIVDDIVDTGRTRREYLERHQGRPFESLFDKTGADAGLGKIVMPWEPDKVEEDDVRHIQAANALVTSLESRGVLQQPVAHLLRTSLGVLTEFVVHNPMV